MVVEMIPHQVVTHPAHIQLSCRVMCSHGSVWGDYCRNGCRDDPPCPPCCVVRHPLHSNDGILYHLHVPHWMAAPPQTLRCHFVWVWRHVWALLPVATGN